MSDSQSEIKRSLLAVSPPLAEVAPFTLSKTEITVGRHPSNDLPLPFDSISRFHARLEVRENDVYVVDFASSNGTFINQERVSEGVLRHGDHVAFGNLIFVFTQDLPTIQSPNHEAFATDRVRFVDANDGSMHSVIQKTTGSEATVVRSLEARTANTVSLDRFRKPLLNILESCKHFGMNEQKIYETTLDLIFDAFPCERGVVLVKGDETGNYRPAHVKVRNAESGSSAIAISRAIMDLCVSDRVAVLSRDVMSDKWFESPQSIPQLDIRSTMCAPILGGDDVLGVCIVDANAERHAFSDSDLDFFTSLTALLSFFYDNARLRREMSCSEQMAVIGETITGMAHNVKNILLLSQGGIGLLDSCLKKKDYDAAEKTWDLIKVGLDRINSMVNEMLDFGRRRRGAHRQAAVNQIIHDTLNLVSTDLANKSIQLSVSMDPLIPECMIDDEGFSKAFLNLLVNATEAVDSHDGRISVSTRYDAEGIIRITVEDNGTGIAAEDLPKIFRPFFTTKGSRGNGLGLAITKKIVEDMDGKIYFQSKLGIGSKFEISLRPKIVEGPVTIVEEPAQGKLAR